MKKEGTMGVYIEREKLYTKYNIHTCVCTFVYIYKIINYNMYYTQYKLRVEIN
jgi:hypothetical protein